MHEILSHLQGGIKISRSLTRTGEISKPLRKRFPTRVYLSDAETIELLKDNRHLPKDDSSEHRYKCLQSALTVNGDIEAGYQLQLRQGAVLHLVDKKDPNPEPPSRQWLGKDIRLESKTLSWGPNLAKSRGRFPYLISFEPFRRNRGLERSAEQQRVQRPAGKMRSWAQILTTPTADTPGTAVLLHFDKGRYLFGNVSEGTQRMCTQGRVGLSRIGSIFLTGIVNWHSTGGILGMILTLADIAALQNGKLEQKLDRDGRSYVEKPRLALHGGKNLTHLLATARRFVFRKGMPLDLHEIKDEQVHDDAKIRDCMPTYTDDNIKLWAMTIKSDMSSTKAPKRSHDKMSEEAPPVLSKVSASGVARSEEELEDINDQIRKGVVSHMFDSDWRLDALHPMNLRDVEMPATVFVKNSSGKIEKYEGLLPGGGVEVPDLKVLVRKPWPGAKIRSLPPTTPATEAISYIVKNHPQRGKFDPIQARLLGVPAGPRFRELTEGKSVKTANGKVVTPDMVLGPGKQGGGFAIVELPDRTYLDNLIDREEWSSKEVMDGVGAIIWILGRGVVDDGRLLNFQAKHSELSHIISSPETSPNRISLDGAAAAAMKLNQVDPERFPVPVSDDICADLKSHKSIKALPGLVLQLEPKIEIQSDKVFPVFSTTEFNEEVNVEVLKLAKTARKSLSDPVCQALLDSNQQDIPSRDAEVIILGSGSALPSKYRNVSATLLRVPGYGSYLFDCGENTLGQMKRVFGAELPQVLKDLRLIWISHLHADHHLGTASVVKEWYKEIRRDQSTQSNRLMVASERGMLEWLEEYSQVEDYGYSSLHLLPMKSNGISQRAFDQADMEKYGISSITTCPVNHCNGSLAVVLEFPNDFKVAYSGDCLPSNVFASIGKGATLLIHEATFDDELSGDALAKKHSTTGDALRIGRLMEARRILLTHFSQRYQKIPVMEDKNGNDQVVIVAFDYMRVKIGDFAKADLYRLALLELYKDKEE